MGEMDSGHKVKWCYANMLIVLDMKLKKIENNGYLILKIGLCHIIVDQVFLFTLL